VNRGFADDGVEGAFGLIVCMYFYFHGESLARPL
jgi:hypothetical protein